MSDPGTGADPAAISRRAESLLDLGRSEEAVPLLLQAMAADPHAVRPRCLLSLAFFKLRDFRRSLKATISLRA